MTKLKLIYITTHSDPFPWAKSFPVPLELRIRKDTSEAVVSVDPLCRPSSLVTVTLGTGIGFASFLDSSSFEEELLDEIENDLAVCCELLETFVVPSLVALFNKFPKPKAQKINRSNQFLLGDSTSTVT
jgi:hypothetical protein